jgi:hypothetical protein
MLLIQVLMVYQGRKSENLWLALKSPGLQQMDQRLALMDQRLVLIDQRLALMERRLALM